MKKKIMTALAGALFLMLTCSSFTLAGSIPITPFEMGTPYGFDINVLGTQVSELDWLPGSGLAVNANPFEQPGGAGDIIEFLYQLKLGNIIDVKGNNLTRTTLNGMVGSHPTPYEFTAIGRMWEDIDNPGDPTITFTLADDQTGGSKPNVLEIYADVYDGVGTPLVPTPGLQADVSAGTGFCDGVLVLRATPIELNGVFTVTDSNGNGALDNQDYGTGSVQTIFQVEFFDPDFFSFPPADGPPQIQMQFDGTLTLPPAGVETQVMWDGTVPDYYTGLSDGTTPFNTEDLLMKVDGNSHSFVSVPPPPMDCRVTAGGNKDGFTVPCVVDSNLVPESNTCAEDVSHTWGGQAGAQPRVDGNWTHHYKESPKKSFGFHSNSLFFIECSDPGPHCVPAGCYAPSRQIDFAGIGRFTHKKGVEYTDPLSPCYLPDEDLCFEVHLEDIGEPGKGGRWPISVAKGLDCEHCPGTLIVNGDPEDPDYLEKRSDCRDCPDYYEIKIYDSDGYDDKYRCTGNVLWENGLPHPNCAAEDPQLKGFFTRAGNVQMHRDNN